MTYGNWLDVQSTRRVLGEPAFRAVLEDAHTVRLMTGEKVTADDSYIRESNPTQDSLEARAQREQIVMGYEISPVRRIEHRFYVEVSQVPYTRYGGGCLCGGGSVLTLEYLEKIIQIPFSLPPIDERAVQGYVRQIAGANLPDARCSTVFSVGAQEIANERWPPGATCCHAARMPSSVYT